MIEKAGKYVKGKYTLTGGSVGLIEGKKIGRVKNLEKLQEVLYVGRPAFGQENSTISMFRLDQSGNGANRVQVKTGRASVNQIQIDSGLKEGDTVILSDMSRWDNTDRVRLE